MFVEMVVIATQTTNISILRAEPQHPLGEAAAQRHWLITSAPNAASVSGGAKSQNHV